MDTRWLKQVQGGRSVGDLAGGAGLWLSSGQGHYGLYDGSHGRQAKDEKGFSLNNNAKEVGGCG